MCSVVEKRMKGGGWKVGKLPNEAETGRKLKNEG